MTSNSRGKLSRSPDGAQSAPRHGQRVRPKLERLEDRCVPAAFRTIDGTGNNALHPDWGSAGVDLLRIAGAAYADGLSAPTVGDPARPSAREISNVIVAQTTPDRVISARLMSAMIYGWGQFIDHDIDLTPAGTAETLNVDATGDPLFDPPGYIGFTRSIYDPATGTTNARQQPNVITAFLDGSMIYGSSDAVAAALRTGSGGRLKTSPGADGIIGTQDDLLPYNNTEYFTADQIRALNMANGGPTPNDQLFAAGDVRANENIELTSLQTLFVREHNRLADAIHKTNPGLGDEAIYQIARSIVGAEIESITYNQWLPTVLGPNGLPQYRGYKPSVNPGVATEFSTALFRLGHSMLGDDVAFLDNNGNAVADPIPLRDAFFNPGRIPQTDIGPILKYLASDPSSEVDNSIVDDLRNFLFGPPGAGGFDLASLNIQRGRDHGLADYNTVRAAYGLPKVTSFSQISSNPDIQAKLESLYGNVDNIDLWVGALAEDHVPGASVGPLIRAGLIDQFRRLRDGDSFFFERAFSGTALFNLEHTTLADIIARNTPINNLQNNVFFFRVSVSGTVFNDLNRNGRQNFGEPGLAGWTVQLYSVEGGVQTLVAQTTTGAGGRYTFNVASGLELGDYVVREVLPAGWRQTSADPGEISLTRGETFVTGINFGNARSSGKASALVVTGPTDVSAASTTSIAPTSSGPSSLPTGSAGTADVGSIRLPVTIGATTSAPAASATDFVALWTVAKQPMTSLAEVLGDWFAATLTGPTAWDVRL
jgi:hypothetical protein